MTTWDPGIYTEWIHYDMCRMNCPPGCGCAPMPKGCHPFGAAPEETEVASPPPSTTTPEPPKVVTLPHLLASMDGAVEIAAELVGAGLMPDLAASMAPALVTTGINWYITSARRTAGEQEALIRLGQTATPPERSNHVPCPGDIWSYAVDLDPAVGEHQERAELARLAQLLQNSVTPFGPWRWGGTFSRPSPHHFDVRKPC